MLHEGTLMWFSARQDFIHAGWMQKMGGGTSTLGRKNWKRRWMTLKGGELHYHPSQEEDATVLGIVDIQSATDIVEGVPAREFGFQIVTPSRSYPMSTDTGEELAEWMDLLRSVKGKSKEEIQTLLDNARVNPRNAEVGLPIIRLFGS